MVTSHLKIMCANGVVMCETDWEYIEANGYSLTSDITFFAPKYCTMFLQHLQQ